MTMTAWTVSVVVGLCVIMKWHLFNPEHDLALASGAKGFSPPAAGVAMRHWLGFLPAFWAEAGDVVLVDDRGLADSRARTFAQWIPEVRFLTLEDCRGVRHQPDETVDVWGWDQAVRWQLCKAGFPGQLLPEEEAVERIRHLSHRETSVGVLRDVVLGHDKLIGERHCLHDIEEVRHCLHDWRHVVVKAPWSSSGRGVRYLYDVLSPSEEGFVINVLRRQGSIIAEPLYDRVLDLAVEWTADGMGNVTYEGLSLFDTENGAYTGNLLIPEEQKWQILAGLISLEWLRVAISRLEQTMCGLTREVYRGTFGVDMMVVRTEKGYRLHPCVEINLRRTMGHVALAVAMRTQHQFRQMRIIPSQQYSLLLI